MKNVLLLLVSIVLLFTANACKNDAKPSDSTVTVAEEATGPKKAREMTSEEKFTQNSVLIKAMSTPELSTFVSFSLSTGLSEVISKEEGPYTLLAPSSAAFKERSAMLMAYQHVDKKDSLIHIIGSHIIKGNIDSAAMVSNIRAGNGSYKLTTYTGEELTVQRKGLDIVVKDKYGNEATLGKTDIVGGNGVVHVIDNVLILN